MHVFVWLMIFIVITYGFIAGSHFPPFAAATTAAIMVLAGVIVFGILRAIWRFISGAGS